MRSHFYLGWRTHSSTNRPGALKQEVDHAASQWDRSGRKTGKVWPRFVGIEWELSGNELPLEELLDEKKPDCLDRALPVNH